MTGPEHGTHSSPTFETVRYDWSPGFHRLERIFAVFGHRVLIAPFLGLSSTGSKETRAASNALSRPTPKQLIGVRFGKATVGAQFLQQSWIVLATSQTKKV